MPEREAPGVTAGWSWAMAEMAAPVEPAPARAGPAATAEMAAPPVCCRSGAPAETAVQAVLGQQVSRERMLKPPAAPAPAVRPVVMAATGVTAVPAAGCSAPAARAAPAVRAVAEAPVATGPMAPTRPSRAVPAARVVTAVPVLPGVPAVRAEIRVSVGCSS